MTWTAEDFLVLNPQLSEAAFGLAIADELRARHPHSTSGHVAQRLGVGKKTAENILVGHLSARTLTRLVCAYGLALLVDAGARVTGQTLSDFIRARAAEARQEAAYWDALDIEEQPIGPSNRPSLSHRVVERSRGDGCVP